MQRFFVNYLFTFIFLLSSFIFSVSPALAADVKPPCARPFVNGNCPTVTTGLGDVGTNFTDAVSTLFLILLGFTGSIAVILIIFSGYNMMISQGNAEKVKGARETLTAAITGLLFILFSGALLQIIGVNILRIPGFN